MKDKLITLLALLVALVLAGLSLGWFFYQDYSQSRIIIIERQSTNKGEVDYGEA